MAFADYNEFIQRELQPEIIDTVIYDSIEPFLTNFNSPPITKGDRITSRVRTAHTSNAAFYDKTDVDPASASQTLVKPYWSKVFSHGACEVHGIDMSNDNPGGASLDELSFQVKKETEALMAANVSAIYTQIKKDVDSSSVAYGDGSLSRSTYPTLVSYEEDTNATISLAYMRGMIRGCTTNKGTNLGDYICLMEDSVYYTFKALAAALHTWNAVSVAGQKTNMGYPDFDKFEGLACPDPSVFTNMTTGDVLMLRRQDVNIAVHRPLEIEAVQSGRDSIKMVLRTGINVYVDNPYLQGKMTDKD
ncbi:MAG: hypothetical protein GY854_01815 [Deltaproteobacteria bacterium]|nr:hypothetical protein [Deltaproteobacteria bacterium]